MVQICPACNAENRDVAKYCDQCAAALTPDAVPADAMPVPAGAIYVASPAPGAEQPAAPASPARPVNWAGMFFLLLVVGAVVWIALMPTNRTQAQLGVSAGPSGSPGGPAGPHGHGAGTMEDVMKQIEELKAKLEADPTDGAALTELYGLYGQIGEGHKVRPYLETAVEKVRSQNDSGEVVGDAATKKLAGIALAALQGGDNEGAIVALSLYHELEPKNLGVVATIGNLYYDSDKPREAIEWYERYLAVATPQSQGDDYDSVRVDKATMHLHLGEEEPSQREVALELLQRVTEEQPEHWSAWFNLGHAHQKLEQSEQALTAFRRAEELAPDALKRWQSETKIAELEGKEPPPMPNPHADGSVPMTVPGH